jgi:hypothetical protein
MKSSRIACAVCVLWLATVAVLFFPQPDIARAEDEQGGLIVFGVKHPHAERLCWASCDQKDFYQIHAGSIVPVYVSNGTKSHTIELELVRYRLPMRFDKNPNGCKRLLPGERLTPANCDGTIGGYWETRFPDSLK